MKTQSKARKSFDTVKVFREIKEKIARETAGMTYEQFNEWSKIHRQKLHAK
jgi:hypothetical protein